MPSHQERVRQNNCLQHVFRAEDSINTSPITEKNGDKTTMLTCMICKTQVKHTRSEEDYNEEMEMLKSVVHQIDSSTQKEVVH